MDKDNLKPGDDYVTLPPIPDELQLPFDQLELDAPSEEMLWVYLPIQAFCVAQYAEEHQLSNQQKNNLVGAFCHECSDATRYVVSRIMKLRPWSVENRNELDSKWRGYCQQLIDAVRDSVHKGANFERSYWMHMVGDFVEKLTIATNLSGEEDAIELRKIRFRDPKTRADRLLRGKSEPVEPEAKGVKRFTFGPGQALFDANDLNLPSGSPIEMLKKLVARCGKVVPYAEFDKHYSSAAPGTVHKDKSTISTHFANHSVPYEITAKTGEGYVLRPKSSEKRSQKRVRK